MVVTLAPTTIATALTTIAKMRQAATPKSMALHKAAPQAALLAPQAALLALRVPLGLLGRLGQHTWPA